MVKYFTLASWLVGRFVQFIALGTTIIEDVSVTFTSIVTLSFAAKLTVIIVDTEKNTKNILAHTKKNSS